MAKSYINPGLLRFTAIINHNSAVEFPYDLKQTYGVGNLVPIKATFDGHVVYQGSLAKMGGDHALLLIRNDVRAQIGKNPGDSVDIEVELDDQPRQVEVPADLRSALDAAGQSAAFDALAYTHRKEYVRWVEEAKRPETRSTRIAKSVEMIAAGQKRS